MALANLFRAISNLVAVKNNHPPKIMFTFKIMRYNKRVGDHRKRGEPAEL